MAAPSGCWGGDESMCQKISGGGEWRCNLLAMDGNPFCHTHYALEMKKIQQMYNRSSCHKVIGGGLWRCTRVAMSGNPFCETHYALEKKKIQHMMRGENGVNEGGGERKRGKPNDLVNKGKEKVFRENDDGVQGLGGVRPKAEGVQNKRNTGTRHGDDAGQKKPVLVETSRVDLAKEDEIGVCKDNIKKRGRGRPKKVQTKPVLVETSRVDLAKEDVIIMKRGRGRPKKDDAGQKKPVLVEASRVDLAKEDGIIMKRGRGRPKKDDAGQKKPVLVEASRVDLAKEDGIIKKRGRGRPKKVDTNHGKE